MRKVSSAFVAIVLLTLLVSVPAQAASGGSENLRSRLVIHATMPPGYWWGTVSGDLNGTVKYESDPDHEGYITGKTAHFYEVFTICVDSTDLWCSNPATGEWISGVDHGTYNLGTRSGEWHFMANGWVTDASPEYAYLIRYKYHEGGVTTDPFADTADGEGTAFLAAP